MARITVKQKKEEGSVKVPKRARRSGVNSLRSGIDRNGHSTNGNGSLSFKTIEEVRKTTEDFFVRNLKTSRAVAKDRAKRLTENWERDLELTK